jgi:glutathione synthase/RimK-type ligase-like ATP-grasp enzyme
VIVVWGSLDDAPVAYVLDALDDGSTQLAFLDDTAPGVPSYDIELGPTLRGWVELEGRKVALDDIDAMYLRPGPVASAAGRTASSVLLAVAESLPGTVVNRPSAGWSNHSKPYQSTLLATHGLRVPDTLCTSDPAAARTFLARHGRIVFKSISGVRSIVAAVDDDADGAARLDTIGHGPVQLQQWIDGTDVRVHVVGDALFATEITSEATDYRYGEDAVFAASDVPAALGERLVSVAHGMGLLLAGIDLRRTAAGEWHCFEVNPSPGFTYYEDHTGQPIASAVAALLRRSTE